MADENRRPGDWQRKDLRRDANDLVGEPNPKKWYEQTFWIIFFLVVIWPFGIVLVWRSNWHIVAKVAASLFVALAVYFALAMSQAVNQLPAS